jgi:hypothetical protein
MEFAWHRLPHHVAPMFTSPVGANQVKFGGTNVDWSHPYSPMPQPSIHSQQYPPTWHAANSLQFGQAPDPLAAMYRARSGGFHTQIPQQTGFSQAPMRLLPPPSHNVYPQSNMNAYPRMQTSRLPYSPQMMPTYDHSAMRSAGAGPSQRRPRKRSSSRRATTSRRRSTGRRPSRSRSRSSVRKRTTSSRSRRRSSSRKRQIMGMAPLSAQHFELRLSSKRKSPAVSARISPLGVPTLGQDLNMWQVVETKDGVRRWQRL